MTTPKTQRRSTKLTECTIIAIYKFKTAKKLNGTRCTLLRNGGGKEHKVWTHANGLASHCDCDGFEKSHGRRKCYHIKHVEALEAAKRAAALPEPEMSEEDKAQLAIVVAKMSEDVTAELVATPAPAEVAPVARELRCFRQWGEYTPQYRDENGDWQNFKNEHGYSVIFLGGYADLAWKYVAQDSDEHRAAVWAELLQAVADAEAAEAAQSQAETVRDLVAVAASNAAQAGPAIDKAFAESERRLTSTLKAGRGIGLAPIVAPVIAAGRAVPMK